MNGIFMKHSTFPYMFLATTRHSYDYLILFDSLSSRNNSLRDISHIAVKH